MDIAIVGRGISGGLLLKKLSNFKHKNHASINKLHSFDAEKTNRGKFYTHFSPDSEIKENFMRIKNNNFKFVNRKISEDDIKKISRKYDITILAMGGEERQLDIPNGNLIKKSTDVIHEYKTNNGKLYEGKIVSIIGNGNSALDLTRNIFMRGASAINIIGRKNYANSKFSIPELKKTIAEKNITVKNNLGNADIFYAHKNKINSHKNLNFHFNFSPERMIDKNTLILKNQLTGENVNLKSDLFISAIGYEKNKNVEIFEKILQGKNYFKIGWASLGSGTVSDVTANVCSVFNKLLSHLKK